MSTPVVRVVYGRLLFAVAGGIVAALICGLVAKWAGLAVRISMMSIPLMSLPATFFIIFRLKLPSNSPASGWRKDALTALVTSAVTITIWAAMVVPLALTGVLGSSFFLMLLVMSAMFVAVLGISWLICRAAGLLPPKGEGTP